MSFNTRIIVISGTPGTGKTEVALRLSKILNAGYVNLTEFVISNSLYMYYDPETSSYVINEELLRSKLRDMTLAYRGYMIIDGHYGELVDDELLDKIIILRLDPRVLYRRLLERGWVGRKLIDNIEGEFLGVCTANALELHSLNKVCEVDTTGKSFDDVVREVLSVITGELECRVFVDWLSNNEVVSWILETISREVTAS